MSRYYQWEAATVMGAVAVGFAVPAWADGFEAGKYSVVRSAGIAPGMPPGAAPAMWTVSSCGPGCQRVVGDNGVTWDTHLTNGRWTGSVHREDAVNCENGIWARGTSEFSLDPQTLRGTIVSTSDGPACGSPTPITGGAVDINMDHA